LFRVGFANNNNLFNPSHIYFPLKAVKFEIYESGFSAEMERNSLQRQRSTVRVKKFSCFFKSNLPI